MRPSPTTLSSLYCSIFARRYVPGVHCDSWMMPWYMSVMYIVPSGADVDVDGAEERIGRADELGQRIDVAQLRQPSSSTGRSAAHDAADDFAVEVVAEEIRGQPVAAEDVVAGAGGPAASEPSGMRTAGMPPCMSASASARRRSR